MNTVILPEFQDYLVSRRLVSKKYVSYHAYWVSGFIAFSNSNDDLTLELRIKGYLNFLSNRNLADWQLEQAQMALDLYVNHFLDGDNLKTSPNEATATLNYDYSKILAKMRKIIQLKKNPGQSLVF